MKEVCEACEGRCPVHGDQEHGAEAQELQQGIQSAIDEADEDEYGNRFVDARALEKLLRKVDARDSLVFVERIRRLVKELYSTVLERDEARAQFAEAQAGAAAMRRVLESRVHEGCQSRPATEPCPRRGRSAVAGHSGAVVCDQARTALASPHGRPLLDENARLREEVERLRELNDWTLKANREVIAERDTERRRAEEATAEVERLRGLVEDAKHELLSAVAYEVGSGHDRLRAEEAVYRAARWKALAKHKYILANTLWILVDSLRCQAFGLAWAGIGEAYACAFLEDKVFDVIHRFGIEDDGLTDAVERILARADAAESRCRELEAVLLAAQERSSS